MTAWKTFLINHQELHAVENNSGDVADDEDDNDEDEDSDEVELSLDISTPLSLVGSRKIFSKWSSQEMSNIPLLYSEDDLSVEEGEGCSWYHTGENDPTPVLVISTENKTLDTRH